MILIYIPHTVLHDSHITIAQFVILVDKILLGGLVSLIGEFFRLKER